MRPTFITLKHYVMSSLIGLGLLLTFNPNLQGQECKKVNIETTNFTSECGSGSWMVRYELAEAAGANGGYIIQKVKWQGEINNCDSVIWERDTTYWEAWEVKPGEDTTRLQRPSGAGKPAHNDNFFIRGPKRSKGFMKVKGEVAFFNNPDTGKIIDDTWKPSDLSGILPATGKEPPFWKNVDKNCVATRCINFTWDCCGPTDTIRIDTTIVNPPVDTVVVDTVIVDTTHIDTTIIIIDTTVIIIIIDTIPHDTGVIIKPGLGKDIEKGRYRSAEKPNEKLLWSNKLKISPNPTNGWITIRLEEPEAAVPVQLELYSVSGQQIKRQYVPNLEGHRVDLASLPNGYYILSIMDAEGHSVTRKILKQ